MRVIQLFLCVVITQVIVCATPIDSVRASALAKASYEDKTNFSKQYSKNNNTIRTAKTHGVRYYIIEDSENSVVVIRGTDNIRNILTDVMATDETFLDDENIMVHQGFYSVAKEIFKTIKFDAKKPVVLIGHSLGGAVALLYGAMLHEKGLSVSVYTFGMPPVVNKAFIKKYQSMPHYRYFHIFDPLPSLSKPTVQFFQTQMKFKSFVEVKNTLSNMVDTIKNVPDKYRHHGYAVAIKTKLAQLKEQLKESLFFKTTTLYFDYHKIDNYFSALKLHPEISKSLSTQSYTKLIENPKPMNKRRESIKIIPSVLKGTTPLEFELYIEAANNDISMYYINFGNEEEVLLKELKNNKISHTFKYPGKHDIQIALKDSSGQIAETHLTVTTREPTFQEYQEAFEKELNKYAGY